MIRLTVEYDGTGLCGWQRQENGPSVQEHLEVAIARMVGAPVTVIGASRTDAGVHALGQVVSFETDSAIRLDGFRMGLTSNLPESIAVVAAEEAAPDFHARFSAIGKHYRYSIFTRPSRSPLLAHRAWHRVGELDVEAMRAAASEILGERDFSAFRAAGCTARTATRRIDRIELTHTGAFGLDIDVRGNAFLRNMVRILVGTLVDVGARRLTPSQVAEIVASRDRTRAGQTAPAHGLCLVEVFYSAEAGQVREAKRPRV